jgi:hypothetical protein
VRHVTDADAATYIVKQLHQLVDSPDLYRLRRLSRWPRSDYHPVRKVRGRLDQWILGPGRFRFLVDRRQRRLVLLTVRSSIPIRPPLPRILYLPGLLLEGISVWRQLRREKQRPPKE